MLSDRSFIVVNFHSAALTRGAIASARSASSLPLETIVIDNSCDPSEVERLGDAGADRLIVAERNLGYGSAINRAAAVASGEELIISNPDVLFHPRAIDLLSEALTASRTIAGPKIVWDQAGRWILPPAEILTGLGKLGAVAASRSRARRDARARRRFEQRLAFWRLETSTTVPALSGAVLAIRRDLFRELRGFDERFFLFFEETDLSRRLPAIGGRAQYIPSAVCRHLYAQTPSSDRAVHFATSERLYLRKWSESWADWLAARFARSPATANAPDGTVIELPQDGHRYIAELSPLPDFETAAGWLDPTAEVTAPDEVTRSFRGGELFLRLVNMLTGEPGPGVRLRTPLE